MFCRTHQPHIHTQPALLFERLKKIDEHVKSFKAKHHGNNSAYYVIPTKCAGEEFWENHGGTLIELLKLVQSCFLGKEFEKEETIRSEAKNIIARYYPGLENGVSFLLKNLNMRNYYDVRISLPLSLPPHTHTHTQNYRLLLDLVRL